MRLSNLMIAGLSCIHRFRLRCEALMSSSAMAQPSDCSAMVARARAARSSILRCWVTWITPRLQGTRAVRNSSWMRGNVSVSLSRASVEALKLRYTRPWVCG